jgi:hypothetical protein
MTDLNLRELPIHSVDLHYHAGQERQPGQTLRSYLAHAVMTGRVVVGCTDHLERYIGIPPSPPESAPLYAQSVAGVARYRADVDELRAEFPTLRLLFGPEIHASPRLDLRQLPDAVIALADYFLCALPGVDSSPEENSAAMLNRLDEIAAFARRADRPVLVCHPFRPSVNRQLVKGEVAPWITALRPRRAFSDAELNRFFLFDVRAVARACRAHDLPIEINGGTVGRIRGLNLPAPLQMLWAAYRVFQEEGVGLAPGSDQHAFMVSATRREGRYVPFDAFEALGLYTAADLPFVRRLIQ